MLILSLLLLAVAAPPAPQPADPARPLHASSSAFGLKSEAEALDLPASVAEDSLRKALDRLREIDAITDPMGSAASGLAMLNVGAGKGPRKIEPALYTALERAANFCRWSEGIHGPLGGQLNGLWGVRGAVEALPSAEEIQAAVASAACGNLILDTKAGTANLAPGSRADLFGFAIGFAVDEAVDVLRGAGAKNGWVRLGNVERAFGPGRDGGGWPFELPAVPRMLQPERVLLLDRAIAVRRSDDLNLGLGGEHWAPYINQKRGRPGGEGVLLTAASGELAVDSEALAVTMFAAGNRLGQSLLGSLTPSPSVLWLLGGGQGPPLTSAVRWSLLQRR